MASDIERIDGQIDRMRRDFVRMQLDFKEFKTLQRMHSCNPLKNPRLFVVVGGGSGGVFLLLQFAQRLLS